MVFVWPGITAVVLLVIVATWAIVTGILQVIAAIRLRGEVRNEWLLALGGVVSVLFGVYVIVNPAPGALALVWLIGIYAIALGATLIGAGFRLRGERGTAGHASLHEATR